VNTGNYFVWANAPLVFVGGVGQAVLGNEINNGTHQAVWVQGNDHVISSNRIHDVVQQTTDSGAVYGGREWTYRGNQIVNNSFTNLRSHLGEDTSAVYLDDCLSGFNVSGNSFRNVSRALLLGGGRDNIFMDNTVDGSHSSEIVHFDSRCSGGGASTAIQVARLSLVPYNTSAAWAKYGERMANILKDDPGEPSGNSIADNRFCHGASDCNQSPATIKGFNSSYRDNVDC
jgi:hypothetical protein